jgi:hypothetical protein
MVKGPLIKDAMSNTPQTKTFTVEFTVVLSALGDDSFDHVPTVVDWTIPANLGVSVVDETEQTITAFQNDVFAQWCVAFETSLPVADAVDEIRRTLLIDWHGNGCRGDHFESTSVDVALNFDSIA